MFEYIICKIYNVFNNEYYITKLKIIKLQNYKTANIIFHRINKKQLYFVYVKTVKQNLKIKCI